MTHSLFSKDKDMTICWFEKYDKEAIKAKIIELLKSNPNDTIEHCKEYSKSNIKKHYGMEIINFYAVNKKNNKPSLVFAKGNKEYYKPLV